VYRYGSGRDTIHLDHREYIGIYVFYSFNEAFAKTITLQY